MWKGIWTPVGNRLGNPRGYPERESASGKKWRKCWQHPTVSTQAEVGEPPLPRTLAGFDFPDWMAWLGSFVLLHSFLGRMHLFVFWILTIYDSPVRLLWFILSLSLSSKCLSSHLAASLLHSPIIFKKQTKGKKEGEKKEGPGFQLTWVVLALLLSSRVFGSFLNHYACFFV